MVPISFALCALVICCLATAVAVRQFTILQCKSGIESLAHRHGFVLQAISRAIQDEGRLLGMGGTELLQAVTQQARKHGIEMAVLSQPNKEPTDVKPKADNHSS